MVYNPRDDEWIPNTTDNPRAICPGKNCEQEYHVILTLGCSPQLTIIMLVLTLNQKAFVMAKNILNVISREATALQTTLTKDKIFSEFIIQCRIFDVG